MPELGTIKRGKELGRKSLSNQHIWCACIDCGKERWVIVKGGYPIHQRCYPCGLKLRVVRTGNEHGSWKGGRIVRSEGYVEIRTYSDSPFSPMASTKGYLMEHRLVMAKHLGRNLSSEEFVHHLNGIRDDNRLENLCIVSNKTHPITRHHLNTELKRRIQELELQLK